MKGSTMHLACIGAVAMLLVAGCAAVAPDSAEVPKTEPTATQPAMPLAAARNDVPAKPQAATAARPAPPAAPAPAAASGASAAPPPAAKAAAPAANVPAPAAAKAPVAPASVAQSPKPVAAPVAAPPAAAAPLDLNALKEQLKETKAIGVFTKLTLKNQVDDLLQQFRDYYQGKVKLTLAELRRSYDLLLMKVLALLQDADQKLASAIVSSREAIWGLLADPKKFATLEG
jgi:hypothetical protein